MIKLTSPKDNDLVLFDNIIKNKNNDRRERLNNIRDIIKDRYKEYKDKLMSLEDIKQLDSFSKTEKEDLRSCYGDNVEFKKQQDVLQTMQGVSIQAVCPYCGISEPDTLDHYLPKGIFPEYSVLPINLVPCCDLCNRNKGEKWLEGGVRRILSFYNDDIPNYKYLFVTITFTSNSIVPTIEYFLEFKEEDRLTKTISMHYRDLNLFERYEKQINEKITGLYFEVLEGSEFLTIQEQKKNLKRRINSLVKRFGMNYWEARLYEATIESQFFEKCYSLSEGHKNINFTAKNVL